MKEIRYTRCYLGGEGHFSGGALFPGEERVRLAKSVRANRVTGSGRVLTTVPGVSWVLYPSGGRGKSPDYWMSVAEGKP